MPDDVNTRLQDRETRHSVYLERYKSGLARRMLDILRDANESLRDQLTTTLARIDPGEDRNDIRRVEGLIQQITRTRIRELGAISPALEAELRELVRMEATFQTGLLASTVPAVVLEYVTIAAPVAEQIYAAATARPFEGRLLSEALSEFAEADAARIKRTIRDGYVTAQTNRDIIRSLLGTRAQNGRDGALFTSARGVEALTRTAVQHYASVARMETFRGNLLVKAVKFSATLDGKTIPICRGLDRRVWPVNAPAIRVPPLHYRCRSGLVPVTKSWRELGVPIDEISVGQRASMNGVVPADLSYGDWLRGQDAAFQDTVMGKTKGALFRRGDLPMDKFVDMGTGRPWTLDDLRRREPEAFRRAGL